MKEIKLADGKIALVDDEDYEYLNKSKWFTMKGYNTYYAVKTRKAIRMHRIILAVNDKMVDHIDGNGLNNQKSNLRICNHSQNLQNSRRSKTKGVYYTGNVSGYRSRIQVNKRSIHLGYFKTEKEAVDAYNKAATYYFGEFACVNELKDEK
jgi:hypothetical protein